MPPVTPRRMCLPCMGITASPYQHYRTGSAARCKAAWEKCDGAPRFAARAPAHAPLEPNVMRKSRYTQRFLPLPERPAVSLHCAMSIRDWPGAERPREKLLERGAHALSDAELLALLLGSGVRGRSAVDLARTLICEFGSLRNLLNAEPPHASGDRTGALCRAQGLRGARAAAFSRSAAQRTGARRPGGDAHLPAGAAA